MEVWRPIKDYEGYEVSNLGRVKSLKRSEPNSNLKGMIMKLSIQHKGYNRVGLSKITNGKSKQVHFFVHRLVAFAFIPNLENKAQINHIDCNKLNNCVENLEWSTQNENMKHSWNNGLRKIYLGEDSPRAKLKEVEVIEIKRLLSLEKPDQVAIANKFKVRPCTISDINIGRSWKHIK